MPRARPSTAAGRGLAAAMLAAAAFAAPAQAGTVTTLVSSSALDLSGYAPNAQLSVELVRKGSLGDVVIGRASGTADALGTLHIAPGQTCWSVFTPQIRAGDTVRVSAGVVTDSVVVPAVTVDPPPLVAATQLTGLAPDGTQVTAEMLDAGGARLGDPSSATATAGAWAAPFAPTVATEARATVVDAHGNSIVVENPPAPRAECPTAKFSTTAVTAVDPGHLVAGTPTINAAGAGQELIVQGPAPDAAALTATLDDGGPQTATAPAPVSGGVFTARFPATALGGLRDGTVTVGVTGGIPLTMTKDIVAPGPPTSTPPPGRYFAPPLVTLEPPEPGAQVRYTLDGSAPGFDSPTFGAAIHVTANETIRAFAVDAAGNPSAIVSLPYQLAPAGAPPGMPPGTNPDNPGTTPGAPPPPTARVAITLAKRISLPRLKARGLTATVELGQGTTAVRFTVYRRVVRRGHRRLKLVASVVRVPGRAGRYRVKLNPRALGLTREGLYRLKVVPGLSRATLDESATRTVWLRIVR